MKSYIEEKIRYDKSSISNKGDIPKLEGKMIYHAYTSYSNQDSKLYLFDFKMGKLKCLNDEMTGVYHTMNADFNKDGEEIIFMGIVDDSYGGEWHIFRYNLITGNLENLTAQNGYRNEDPKYSPDGKKIIFKQGKWNTTLNRMVYQLTEMNLENGKQRIVVEADAKEVSMPYYSNDGKFVYYTKSDEVTSGIYRVSLNSPYRKMKIYVKKGIKSYYPIVWGDIIYFTSWYSASCPVDRIMKVNIRNMHVEAMKFNKKEFNYSDACPISEQLMIVSSTRTQGEQAYDLYLIDCVNYKIYSLSEYYKEINDEREQLGASYC